VNSKKRRIEELQIKSSRNIFAPCKDVIGDMVPRPHWGSMWRKNTQISTPPKRKENTHLVKECLPWSLWV